jgi:predicted 2-oxoglutarate/Fe(II)-dependent dioxygenase YbiX
MKRTDYHQEIYVIEDFLSQEECTELIAIAENIGFEEARVQVGFNQQSMLKGIRNNERILYLNQELADTLWQRALPWVMPVVDNYIAIGLNEQFRYYKYSPGQRFKMHRDGSFKRTPTECSFYTFLLYLNDDFEGGETEFQDICTVSPKQGSLLIFHHPLKHEGKILISGNKYALRSDVMYRSVTE